MGCDRLKKMNRQGKGRLEQLEVIPNNWRHRELFCLFCASPILRVGAISGTNGEFRFHFYEIPKFFVSAYAKDTDDGVHYFCPVCNVRLEIFQTATHIYVPKYLLRMIDM